MSTKPRDMDVYEIFNELANIKDRSNKIEWLRDKFYDHTPLHRIVKMNYCNTIISMLPEGEPPFNKGATDGPTPASLWSYLKMFPVIVRSAQSVKMKASQIERVFIEMLEAVEPKEAETVCLAKDRQLESRWDIDVDMFKQAFPQLNIQDTDMPAQKPISLEDKISNMLDRAKELKAKAKEMTTEARQLEKDAKNLMNEGSNDAANG